MPPLWKPKKSGAFLEHNEILSLARRPFNAGFFQTATERRPFFACPLTFGAGLPIMNSGYGRPLRRQSQVDHVEGEVVADHREREKLKSQREDQDIAGAEARCHEEA